MNAAEITDKLGLHSLRQRAWVCHGPKLLVWRLLTVFCSTLQSTCATSGDGLYEGLEWFEQLSPQGRPQLSWSALDEFSELRMSTSGYSDMS